MNEGRLAEKVALISGTGGGQGREAALLFAAEGARVIGCDIKVDGAAETVEMVKQAGGMMETTAPTDLSTPEGAAQWIDEAASLGGGFDILYNNAGHAMFGPIDELPVDEWYHTVRNELDIVWFCCRAAWPHLIARGGGAVVNVSSIAGRRTSLGFPQAAHSSTKAGVRGMTVSLAGDGARHGIRVNSVSPGIIETPATAAFLDGPLQELVPRIPLQRVGQAREVAYAALFLASDEASYITGADITVDGGFSGVV
jgi:NAD(P)-dependent dehydrogenase (short-subunit alcohol dehydrogenase family)